VPLRCPNADAEPEQNEELTLIAADPLAEFEFLTKGAVLECVDDNCNDDPADPPADPPCESRDVANSIAAYPAALASEETARPSSIAAYMDAALWTPPPPPLPLPPLLLAAVPFVGGLRAEYAAVIICETAGELAG
jgi:hypothetical protein